MPIYSQARSTMFQQRLFSSDNSEDLPYIKEMKGMDCWKEALENQDKPQLIQAGASWCGPCVQLKPILLDIVKAHKGAIDYLYVDIDQHKELAQALKIQSVPHTYIIKGGNLVD